MEPEQVAALSALIREQRVLSLGVVVDGEPWVGLVPYAVAPGFRGLLVHVSRLARHRDGLHGGGRFSALIHRPDVPDGDALQVERVTLTGVARRLPRDGGDHDEARRAYLERLPGAEMTFGLGDFELYRLEPEGGRWVAGFGRALNVTSRGLEQLRQAAE